ncbi:MULTISPECIES: hypothetical protein [unclassified Bacillus (in: firmicutes)]|uniref:hypothetical protein n=1 Tax=unclassified Bacillus (in: firmicutes) TaxID=185979 RepID=UPI00163CF6A2|nr:MULTISPECIES: hypothetical protein [unclassified Bacillus (in: firmicutes)]QNH48717.1 hypothetical protein H7F25_04380 [Bacillus sp. PAMC28571]QNK43012.1 hypothetical protein H7F24_10945 [Bacillus sp. PAMC22265]
MRKYEDIESELFELYDLVEVTENKIDDLEGELNYLNEKVDALESELAAMDVEAGEDE